eukprot:6810054-Prymnesium_polylepis.1
MPADLAPPDLAATALAPPGLAPKPPPDLLAAAFFGFALALVLAMNTAGCARLALTWLLHAGLNAACTKLLVAITASKSGSFITQQEGLAADGALPARSGGHVPHGL